MNEITKKLKLKEADAICPDPSDGFYQALASVKWRTEVPDSFWEFYNHCSPLERMLFMYMGYSKELQTPMADEVIIDRAMRRALLERKGITDGMEAVDRDFEKAGVNGFRRTI